MVEKRLEAEYEAIAKAQDDEQDALLVKENVVGVGIGHKIKNGKDTGDNCLTVFVAQKLDPALVKGDNMVPSTVGKFKTDVIETGYIFAGMNGPGELTVREEVGVEALTGCKRPVQGGDLVGHYKGGESVIATAVTDSTPYPGIPPKFYILGNGNGLTNGFTAMIGDPILQPPLSGDGTYPTHLIARLSRCVPLRFDGTGNYIDAAIAEGQYRDLDREIYWIGYVKGVRCSVAVGEIVQTAGRDAYATGRVQAVNASVNVTYSGGKRALFIKQIITTVLGFGSIAGSLVCDLNENAVGLLFAGSSSVNVVNNICYVRSLLSIRID